MGTKSKAQCAGGEPRAGTTSTWIILGGSRRQLSADFSRRSHLLWWRADAQELPGRFRAAIADSSNLVYLSASIAWEIVIKRALGRLEFQGTIAEATAEEGFLPLPISLSHVDEVASLPDLHRDPFDRMLIAQARAENLVLVTVDPLIRQYPALKFLEG